MSLHQTMVRKLMDVFNKKETSNISKLLLIFSEKIDELNNTLIKIEEWRSVDKAEGTTLDLLGQRVGQERAGQDDATYRISIKSKIAQNHSSGLMNEIIQFAAFFLGINATDVTLQRIKGATLCLEVDYEALENAGLTFEQFGEAVNNLAAAGISVEVYFRGTFMFSDTESIQEDALHGFDDVAQDYVYHEGDFYFSSGSESETSSTNGLTDIYLGSGGYFGAYFVWGGFQDETEEKVKPW